MEAAGLTVRRDAVGNVIGRVGAGPPLVARLAHRHRPERGPVRQALSACSPRSPVAERWRPGGDGLSRSRSSAFADEEGTRFGTTYLGSAAYTGGFERAWLDLVDGAGITLRDAIRTAGGDPETAATEAGASSSPATSRST